MAAYTIVDHEYDVVVVGAGGAGLRATFGMVQNGLQTACVTKVFPTRSHTVAAQGGVGAALGNMAEDNWIWHMYDTVKGSDWLGDQDAIEYMCREAIPSGARAGTLRRAVFHARPRARFINGPSVVICAISGEAPVQRACAAADRTGHAILHTLYQQSLKHKAEFLSSTSLLI